tara:strand:+ start:183 stop:614 length:432 start_codon:yes stop_codon:yes gene_type:complete
MVETFGGNRGITPSISKRVKRQVVRYNRDDNISNINISDKRSYGEYEDISKAKVADLVYYLGDDWIDWKSVDVSHSGTVMYRKLRGKKVKEGSNSEVFRCLKCKRPYETKSMDSAGKVVGDRYLNPNIFNNVPLNKKDCDFCG